jgi:hypothetical protein
MPLIFANGSRLSMPAFPDSSPMRPRSLSVALVVLAVAITGCKQKVESTKNQMVWEDPLPAGARPNGPVNFQIRMLPQANQSQRWQATYVAGGKTARFIFEIDLPKVADLNSKVKSSPFDNLASANGRFIADSASDSAVLLADLMRALDATAMPSGVKRASALPFTYVILADHQTLSDDGGFRSNPAGNWTAIKIFFPNGDDDDAEVFFNLDRVDGVGQFSIKDSDYGNDVLKKLANVL